MVQPDADMAARGEQRAVAAVARAAAARERAQEARAHAEKDALAGLERHRAMHIREAEHHERAAQLQLDAASQQRRHAREHQPG